MNLEEHLETADDLAIALHHLEKVFFRCQEYYPKSHRLMKQLYKTRTTGSNLFDKIKSHLDEEYHRLINDQEFNKLGHIYYNLNERFKKLQEQ